MRSVGGISRLVDLSDVNPGALADGFSPVWQAASSKFIFAAAAGGSYIPLAQKAAPSGVATLDTNTFVPLAQLSGLTTTQLSATAGIVSGQIAGLALDKLTAGTLQVPLNMAVTNTVTVGNTQLVGTANGVVLNMPSGKFFEVEVQGASYFNVNNPTNTNGSYLVSDNTSYCFFYSCPLAETASLGAAGMVAFGRAFTTHPNYGANGAGSVYYTTYANGTAGKFYWADKFGYNPPCMMLDPLKTGLTLYNTGNFGALISPAALTAARTYTLPDKSGTLACLSDITGGASNITPVTTKTANYNPTSADGLVVYNSGSAIGGTLPAATGTGLTLRLKNIGAGLLTITANGAETIDGANTQTVTQWSCMEIIDYATGKWVIT